MISYFAKWNVFTTDLKGVKSVIEHFRGTLNFIEKRQKKSKPGEWVVFAMVKNREIYWFYFDAENISDDEYEHYQDFVGTRVILASYMSSPVIIPAYYHTEEDLRNDLVDGVADGTVKIDDLPALIEFERGNDELFSKWQLFKLQNETEDLEKLRDDLRQKKEDYERDIEDLNAHLKKSNEMKIELEKEEERVLGEIFEILTFLQGEEYLEGENERPLMYPLETKKLIPLPNGYNSLMDVLGQINCKGLCLMAIAAGELHKIHHLYQHDEKGPVILMGSAKEFMKNKPEKVKEMVDKASELLSDYRKRKK